jgi:PDZ domain
MLHSPPPPIPVINTRTDHRVNYKYLPATLFQNDTCNLVVVRDGKEVEIECTVEVVQARVPRQLYDYQPSYYMFGGLVFVPLSQPYLIDQYGKSWMERAPVHLCDLFNSLPESKDDQIVVLSQVLVDDINTGYNGYALSPLQVLCFNGEKVRNLRHLATMIDSSEESFCRFELHEDVTVVLKRQEALDAAPRILENNNIARAKSLDLQ